MQTIKPFLWYDGRVEDAVAFYQSVFNDANVHKVSSQFAEISLNGQELILFNGGPGQPFTWAVSLFISCKDQTEVDYYWDKLLDGGTASMCGWLQDKFGVWWQVVPHNLMNFTLGPDKDRAEKAMQAMMKMKKLNLAEIEAAYNS